MMPISMATGLSNLHAMGPMFDVMLKGMSRVAKAAANDSKIFSRFEADPEGEAQRIAGLEMPAGFHMHIVDITNGRAYPPEPAAAESSPHLQRIEISVRHGQVESRACIFNCMCCC